MLGDVPPGRLLFAGLPAVGTSAVVPSTRGFKIADNNSPEPRDRAFFSFNYFDNLFASLNRGPIAVRNIRAYQETFGLETTFLDGLASVGLSLPLNTLNADTILRSVSGSSTDIGDLSLFLKAVLARSHDGSGLLSAGLAVTAPTGPGSFAGAVRGGPGFHETVLQPFVAYLYGGDFYVQGFSSLAVPTDSNDVTLFFNDVGVGYFLYQAPASGHLLTAIVPTVEAHFNTPLNHRGTPNLRDPVRQSDIVDLTGGVNFGFADRAWLAVGAAVPVTGPRPFDFEILVQLRLWF
jgi:hypothetical protein